MAAGSIIVDLLLRTGSFETDTQRAAKAAKKSAKDIESAFLGLDTFLGNFAAGLVGAFSVGAIVAFTRATIDGLDALNDLADATGASIENLSALEDVARRNGETLDSVSGILIKFNGALKEADGKNGISQALKAIGLDAAELRKIDPAEALRQTAVALSTFEDEGNKARIVQELFGKSIKDAAPFLKDLSEQGRLNATVTKEQAEQAEQFNKNIAALTTSLNNFAREIVGPVISSLNGLIDKFIEAKRESAGMGSLLDGILGLDPMSKAKSQIETLQADIGRTVDSIERMQEELNRKGGDDDFLKTRIDKARARLKGFQDDLVGATQKIKDLADINAPVRAAANAGQGDRPRPTLPALPPSAGSSAPKDDPTRKLLDVQLDALKAQFDAEKTLLAERNRFIDLYNEQGLLSIQEYYSARKVAADEALAGEQKAIDAQIKALEKFRDAPGRTKTERAETEGKIADLLRQRAELERAAGVAGIESAIKQAQEQKRLADEIQGVNAQLLDLQGNLRGAAAIRFDQQNDSLRSRLEAAGNTGALGQLDALRKAALAQAEYGQETVRADKVLQQLGATEERISIARQLGATSEIEGLQQLGVARQDAVRQLEEIVAAQEAVARASGSDVLVRQAEAARLELEKLKATADPLADSLRAMFTDGFGDAFADVITGAKSAKDAFRDFGDEVARQIIRMTTQSISEKLFGSISGAIGGTTGGGSGFAGFLSSIGSFFGGAKASGGDVISGRSYLVGENGPERFVPRTSGTILPSDRASSARRTQVNNINITVPGTTSGQTASQIAAEVSRKLAAANARDN